MTRTHEEFVNLDKELRSNGGPCVPILTSQNVEDLEIYVNLLLELFSAEQLKSYVFQRFIDNADHTSEITKIRLSLIKKHVSVIQQFPPRDLYSLSGEQSARKESTTRKGGSTDGRQVRPTV